MARVDDFDAFCHATRRPLLHQTYALTGDVSRTAAAVEHAYAQAWSQWRKVRRLPDPVAWVRTEAWRTATSPRSRWRRRRSAQRRFGANPTASPHRRDLEALDALPDAQRRAVVLHHLAELPTERIAREIGISETAAESLLARGERAWDQRAASEQVPSKHARPATGTPIATALAALENDIAGVRLARAPHLRRSGDRRHRQQTVLGLATAAALVAGGGLLIANDTPPQLGQAAVTGAVQAPTTAPSADPPMPARTPRPFLLGEDALLTTTQMSEVAERSGQWTVQSTTDGTTGDPLYASCQQEPFADPDGDQSLLRRYESDAERGLSAVQVIEESRNEPQSAKAFDTMVAWYARCADDGVQLVDTVSVRGLGDEARAFTLRDIAHRDTYLTVGIVRTGPITTAVVASTQDSRPVPARRVLERAGVSVTRTCLRVSGDCSTVPELTRVEPLPAEEHPGFLAAFDLPKVSGVRKPWVGTDPAKSLDNPGATACERASFRRGQHPRTRVFVLPTAEQVPRRFGLTETVGTFAARADARAFVRQAIASAEGCAERELSAAKPVAQELPGDLQGRAWRFEFEVSEQSTASYRVGLVRSGRRVALLALSPTKGYDVTRRDFRDLVVRAGHRLTEADG